MLIVGGFRIEPDGPLGFVVLIVTAALVQQHQWIEPGYGCSSFGMRLTTSPRMGTPPRNLTSVEEDDCTSVEEDDCRGEEGIIACVTSVWVLRDC